MIALAHKRANFFFASECVAQQYKINESQIYHIFANISMLINPLAKGEGYNLPLAPASIKYKLDILENPSAAPFYKSCDVLDRVNISLYPGTSEASFAHTRTLVERLYELHGTNADMSTILLTNGSDNAIKLIFEVFSHPDASIIIPNPTYPHASFFASRLFKSSAIITPRAENETDAIRVIHDACGGASAHGRGCVCYIVNPNMPCGYYIRAAVLRELALSNPTCLFVIDEAYYDYSPRESLFEGEKLAPNIIITRTFSKLYGLAGLRIGYLVAPRALGSILRANYNMKNTTEIAAAYALYGLEHVGKPMRALYECERAFLDASLQRVASIPDAPICSYSLKYGNYYLLYCRKDLNVRDICAEFEKYGILVRNKNESISCAIRVGMQDRAANFAVIRTIQLINLPWLIRNSTVGFDLDGTLRADCHSPISESGFRLLRETRLPIIMSNNVTLDTLNMFANDHTLAQIKKITPLDYFRSAKKLARLRAHFGARAYIVIPFCDTYRQAVAQYLEIDDSRILSSLDKFQGTIDEDGLIRFYVVILDKFWFDFKQTLILCNFMQGRKIKKIYITDSSEKCDLYNCGSECVRERGCECEIMETVVPDMAQQMKPIADACGAKVRIIGKPNLKNCKVDFLIGDSECDMMQKIGRNACDTLRAHVLISKHKDPFGVDRENRFAPRYNFERDIFEVFSIDDLLVKSR